MDPRDAIRQFVIEQFYVPQPDALTDEASLLDGGIVDSTGVLEIIAFLERRFGVQVADDEMVPDDLDSIAHIAAYVGRKAGA